jgi:hypothetical protein
MNIAYHTPIHTLNPYRNCGSIHSPRSYRNSGSHPRPRNDLRAKAERQKTGQLRLRYRKTSSSKNKYISYGSGKAHIIPVYNSIFSGEVNQIHQSHLFSQIEEPTISNPTGLRLFRCGFPRSNPRGYHWWLPLGCDIRGGKGGLKLLNIIGESGRNPALFYRY